MWNTFKTTWQQSLDRSQEDRSSRPGSQGTKSSEPSTPVEKPVWPVLLALR
jgi:hypothetical protein